MLLSTAFSGPRIYSFGHSFHLSPTFQGIELPPIERDLHLGDLSRSVWLYIAFSDPLSQDFILSILIPYSRSFWIVAFATTLPSLSSDSSWSRYLTLGLSLSSLTLFRSCLFRAPRSTDKRFAVMASSPSSPFNFFFFLEPDLLRELLSVRFLLPAPFFRRYCCQLFLSLSFVPSEREILSVWHAPSVVTAYCGSFSLERLFRRFDPPGFSSSPLFPFNFCTFSLWCLPLRRETISPR